MLSPDFFTDSKTGKLVTNNPHAALLFQGIWCFADDAGNIENDPDQLQATIFPYSPGVPVDPLLPALFDLGLIVPYEHGGKHYLHVTNWKKHQSLDRPSKPRCPPFDEGSTRARRVFDEGSSRARSEKKGKEKNIIHTSKTDAAPPPGPTAPSNPTNGFHPFALIWNIEVDKAGGILPKVKAMTPGRLAKCRARGKELAPEEWRAVVRKVLNTPFLIGKNRPPGPHQGWKATFDWLVRNGENHVKVRENVYREPQFDE